MRAKFPYKGKVLEGVILVGAHEKDRERHGLLVGMDKLAEGSYRRMVRIPASQVIEWMPDEGNGIALLRQKLIAKITEAHKEKADG